MKLRASDNDKDKDSLTDAAGIMEKEEETDPKKKHFKNNQVRIMRFLAIM